ncbi:transcription antitermination factor NusB [Ectothiorhodospiraceae bacterium BW-2]|nr:transcription antitermination factor NusB [Ectothiorhodospiraceae bacterium BW-2]
MVKKVKPNRKREARHRALQALYQWQLSGSDLATIERQFLEDGQLNSVNPELFSRLLHEIPANIRQLDDLCQPLLDRDVATLDPVELAALRIGLFELLYCPELPYRVAISEAVELAKIYGAEQGHRYVNGVLHKLAQQVRADEVAAGQRR